MLPPLYKFRPVDEYTLDSLREGYVYFSNPTTFNDPFEFRPRFTVFESLRNRRQRVKRNVERMHPLKSIDKRKKIEARIMVNEGMRNAFSESCYLPEEIVKTALVYCTCAQRESIVLWSYYAANHSGICIELNAGRDIILGASIEVRYSDEYPVIENPDWEGDDLRRAFYMKSKQWEHEKEYRVIWGPDDTGSRKHFLNPAALVSVTFGARTTAEDQARIIDATRSKLSHVTFYKARLADRTFSLEFERLEI